MSDLATPPCLFSPLSHFLFSLYLGAFWVHFPDISSSSLIPSSAVSNLFISYLSIEVLTLVILFFISRFLLLFLGLGCLIIFVYKVMHDFKVCEPCRSTLGKYSSKALPTSKKCPYSIPCSPESSLRANCVNNSSNLGTSLVVQGLRILLPMQGMRV